MDPVAIQLGPISIYWYGILVASAFGIGYFTTRKHAEKYGLDLNKIDELLFKLSIAILIGARLGVIVANFNHYFANPSHIFFRAGLGSHGAIITVMILGYFWTKKDNLPYWKIADAIAPAIPIAHIFVRIGNFINGELYGSPSNLPWAIEFPASGQPVHPAQLYEALAALVILPFAFKWANAPTFAGQAFAKVILVHSIVRFFLDFIRQHSQLIGPFVLTQIIALIFVAVSIGILIYKKNNSEK